MIISRNRMIVNKRMSFLCFSYFEYPKFVLFSQKKNNLKHKDF